MRAADAPRLPDRAVREFVDTLEALRLADLSFRDDPLLAPLPSVTRSGGLSRYLLLAASIDVGVDSNDIRPFLHALQRRLEQNGSGLFDLTLEDAPLVMEVIDSEQNSRRLRRWQAKRHVPRILAEANAFVIEQAQGDLDAWARHYDSPRTIVEQLARSIYFQGRENTETRKKMWMLMRWLVRPSPDLRLWDHLSPAGLMVPVDRHVARFAVQAGVIPRIPKGGPFRAQAEAISAYARELFPADPARVDYAFFMWGRGRSRAQPEPDTCHTLLRDAGTGCPLAGSMPCCGRCPG